MAESTDAAGDRLAALIRDEGRLVLATLVRLTGDLQRAEDAVQDAAAQALRTWRMQGIPPNPRAWLIVTAKNRALDTLRREGRRGEKEREAMHLDALQQPDEPDESALRDDQLRLLFLCCHPALDAPARVALSLKILGGLSVAEVADGMLTSEATMARRLSRAKAKIRAARIPYRVPGDDELPARLDAVATVVFLIFNEGYASRRAPGLQRAELADEAVRLARLIARLMPGEATAEGLLATLLLQHSRRAARLDGDEIVLLADQDRSRWDAALAAEGIERAARAIRLSSVRPNRYAVTAAIAACHVLAPTYAQTDWSAIVDWYDVLMGLDPSPVVLLNRAVALGERDGAAAGLAALESVAGLEDYPWLHATRAELLLRAERPAESVPEFDRAIALYESAADGPVVRHLRSRRAAANL